MHESPHGTTWDGAWDNLRMVLRGTVPGIISAWYYVGLCLG